MGELIAAKLAECRMTLKERTRYLNEPGITPLDKRITNLQSLMELIAPVPDEWKRPSEPKTERGNSSIYLISLTPPALGKAAYHGFAGEFIRAVSRYTEATDAGILAHLLPAVGTYIGPAPHVWGGDEQPARINTALVGPTSTGRKGTSYAPVRLLMEKVDADFWNEQCVRGLSSGEGLIAKVSDKRYRDDDGKEQVELVEKRLYVVESEFSKVLAQTRRDGNILSQVLRETYDSGNLAVLTRNPLHANKAHISITGHITPEELRKRLSEVEMANGFGNRFLWFAVHSDKELPDGDPIPSRVIDQFAKRLQAICKHARRFRLASNRFARDELAKSLWETAYSNLRKARPGLQGAMLARGESIVLRLSLLYALLDQSEAIRCEHIEAALAVWQYNVDSVETIFKQKSGDALADKLYRLLDRGPMMTKDFHTHMNVSSGELRDALGCLVEMGLAKMTKVPQKGPGRPSEQWERIEGETR